MPEWVVDAGITDSECERVTALWRLTALPAIVSNASYCCFPSYSLETQGYLPHYSITAASTGKVCGGACTGMCSGSAGGDGHQHMLGNSMIHGSILG